MGFLDMTYESKVAQFVEAAGKQPWQVDEEPLDFSILACIREETEEFLEAARNYDEALETPEADLAKFRAELVKEWADLQYVVSQASWYFRIPAEAAFNRVHNSNMTKVVDGKVIFREDGKIMKPDTYVAPDMGGL